MHEHRHGCPGIRATLLAALLLCSFQFTAHAQTLDVATQLFPWPPAGWPTTADGQPVEGEVRLDVLDDNLNAGATLASFPIGAVGEVVYRLPLDASGMPRDLFDLVTVADFGVCPGVSPLLSPPEGQVAMAALQIYADGTLWGVVDMVSSQEEGLLSSSIAGILGIMYARDAISIGGSGVCSDRPLEFSFELTLEPGLNIIRVEGVTDLNGTSIRFSRAETLEGSQTPAPLGQ